jgi:hypothetical protein
LYGRTWNESEDGQKDVEQHIEAVAAAVNEYSERWEDERQHRQENSLEFVPLEDDIPSVNNSCKKRKSGQCGTATRQERARRTW